MEEGLSKLDQVIEMMRADLSVIDRSMIFNTDLCEARELDDMLAQASVSLYSAIGRGWRVAAPMHEVSSTAPTERVY